MNARALLAAPLVAAALAWQLLAAADFEREQLLEPGPAACLRRARAPLEERLRADLGPARYPVFRAVRDHVPESDRVVFVTPEFAAPAGYRNANALLVYTALLFPRWMLPAVQRPGLDLALVHPRGDFAIWFVDLDSGFGIDFASHCERVDAGEGFTLWRLRGDATAASAPLGREPGEPDR